MNNKIFFVLLACLIKITAIFAQEKWKFEMVFGENDFGPINTFLIGEFDETNTLVQFHSTPNADKRIFGNGKSVLLRMINKVPKKGVFTIISDIEIIRNADGTDSIKGKFSMPMLGVSPFKGIKTNDIINGSFYSKNYGVTIKLTGVKTASDARFNYENLPQRIFDTTQKYLFNTTYLETAKWKKFKKRTAKLAAVAADDIDLFFGFNLNSSKLPFSHYNLMFGNPVVQKVTEESFIEHKTYNNVFFKEINKETALLEVKSFAGGALEMDSVFSIVHKAQYQNLIIDLRNNTGGGLSPANVLGGYLINEELNTGYFVTNKWYSEMGLNNIEFESLPASKEVTTMGFQTELMNTKGCKLIIRPGESHFNGKIFLLTNNKTASTCEPMVYAMKKNKIATVVGENTAGAMLSAANFHVFNNIYLFMAQADYYTPDKTRLDQVGVAPDIEVPEKEALDYVIKLISEE